MFQVLFISASWILAQEQLYTFFCKGRTRENITADGRGRHFHSISIHTPVIILTIRAQRKKAKPQKWEKYYSDPFLPMFSQTLVAIQGNKWELMSKCKCSTSNQPLQSPPHANQLCRTIFHFTELVIKTSNRFKEGSSQCRSSFNSQFQV